MKVKLCLSDFCSSLLQINPSRDPIPRNGRRDDTVELLPNQNEGRGFVDEENILALLERNARIRPKMEEIRTKSDDIRPKLEEIRRGQGRAVDIANLLSELMNKESEKEELGNFELYKLEMRFV